MFGKKLQILKYDPKAFSVLPSDTEPLFVKLTSAVTSAKAKIEVPVNHFAFILKSGDYGEPIGTGVYDIFNDKQEKKQWKKGYSVEIIFTRKDKAVVANWVVEGDSSTIFEDKQTKEIIKFRSAFGSFSAKITSPTIFHREVVGDEEIYRVADLERDALDAIKSAFIDCFFNAIEEQNIDFVSIVRHRANIAKSVCDALNREISHQGYKFEYIRIDTLNIDYEAAKNKKHEKVAKEEILSETDTKLREIRHMEEDREFEKQKKMAEIEAETIRSTAKAKTTKEDRIQSVFCPNCARENPSSATYCAFCHAKLIK